MFRLKLNEISQKNLMFICSLVPLLLWLWCWLWLIWNNCHGQDKQIALCVSTSAFCMFFKNPKMLKVGFTHIHSGWPRVSCYDESFFIYILFDLWLCLFWLSANMHDTWRMLWTAWNLRYVIWLLALMFKISILLLHLWQMISNWLDGKMCNFEGYFISTEIILYDTAVTPVKCIFFFQRKRIVEQRIKWVHLFNFLALRS